MLTVFLIVHSDTSLYVCFIIVTLVSLFFLYSFRRFFCLILLEQACFSVGYRQGLYQSVETAYRDDHNYFFIPKVFLFPFRSPTGPFSLFKLLLFSFYLNVPLKLLYLLLVSPRTITSTSRLGH